MTPLIKVQSGKNPDPPGIEPKSRVLLKQVFYLYSTTVTTPSVIVRIPVSKVELEDFQGVMHVRSVFPARPKLGEVIFG